VRLKDRSEAGERLADKLERFKDEEAVVYALPRGGVVLGAIIARRLNAPFDLVITRKIGHPWAREYAIGAIAEDGSFIGNEAELAEVDESWLGAQIEAERKEARRRRQVYLGGREPLPVEGKTAIIVDDGVATGLTLLAAIRQVRHRHPRRIIVAVPVIPQGIARVIRGEVDELVALEIPVVFLRAVALYYDDFSAVEDDEVIELMRGAKTPSERVRAAVS
jgi:putative phosphoribosyl transferase